MKAKLVQNLSANTLQLLVNQLLGLAIFYILSATLTKNDFGQINLALAVLLAVFNILSLGMDQLIIKRVAAGMPVQNTLYLYICHVLMAGFIFYGMLLAGWLILPNNGIYNLILLIGIGKLLMFFSTPFKQVANGMERFKLSAYMLVASNTVRCVCLLVFMLLHLISIPYIIGVFIIGDAIELLVSIYLFKKATGTSLNIKWNKTGYFDLLREAIPQSGVVIITAALARLDWILIGLFLSTIKLAEYSFAYKVFEMATLPLLAIAPLLIPWFTKIFQQDNVNVSSLQFLLRAELMIAGFIGLVLNICWAPVIDWLTAGKYGAINTTTIFILSLCMPLLYLQNFLWTIFFAQGRLKMILHSFIITLLVNVIADVILIPIYQNEGAAVGFLLSCAAQIIFFMKKNDLPALNNSWQPLLVCTVCAIAAGFGSKAPFINEWIELPVAVLFYFTLLVITGQYLFSDVKRLKIILN